MSLETIEPKEELICISELKDGEFGEYTYSDSNKYILYKNKNNRWYQISPMYPILSSFDGEMRNLRVRRLPKGTKIVITI